MKLYSLVSILGSLYILHYITTKYLLKTYNLKEIIVNYYLISAIFVFIFFKNDFITSIKKIDYKFLILIVLSIISISCVSFEIIAINSNINIGIIESLANAIYLPLIAIISFYFYKTKLSKINLIGIILIAIGSCFVMKLD